LWKWTSTLWILPSWTDFTFISGLHSHSEFYIYPFITLSCGTGTSPPTETLTLTIGHETSRLNQDQTETEPATNILVSFSVPGRINNCLQSTSITELYSSVLTLKADWQLQDFSVRILLFLQVSIGFCIAVCQFKHSSLFRSGIFHILPQADTSCACVTHVVRRWWRLGDCRLINSTKMHTDKGLHTLS